MKVTFHFFLNFAFILNYGQLLVERIISCVSIFFFNGIAYFGRALPSKEGKENVEDKHTGVHIHLKDNYSLLYRTHPQSLLVLWPCYVITYVRWGISFKEM